MTTPSVWSLLVSSTAIVSPALALMVGPGNCPLIPITTSSMQSGDPNMYSTSHRKCLTLEPNEISTNVEIKMHQITTRLNILYPKGEMQGFQKNERDEKLNG